MDNLVCRKAPATSGLLNMLNFQLYPSSQSLLNRSLSSQKTNTITLINFHNFFHLHCHQCHHLKHRSRNKLQSKCSVLVFFNGSALHQYKAVQTLKVIGKLHGRPCGCFRGMDLCSMKFQQKKFKRLIQFTQIFENINYIYIYADIFDLYLWFIVGSL